MLILSTGTALSGMALDSNATAPLTKTTAAGRGAPFFMSRAIGDKSPPRTRTRPSGTGGDLEVHEEWALEQAER